MRSRYCKVCREFHDLSEAWPEACLGHFGPVSTSSIQIIKDIQPYQAMGTDIATGTNPMIKSRREHKEFLKRNGYREVGNEPIRYQTIIDPPDSHREIKQTLDQFRNEGRWK